MVCAGRVPAPVAAAAATTNAAAPAPTNAAAPAPTSTVGGLLHQEEGPGRPRGPSELIERAFRVLSAALGSLASTPTTGRCNNLSGSEEISSPLTPAAGTTGQRQGS
jgi:hypothetical protein